MEDWIEGPVLRVIDGDTFEMQVAVVGAGNDFPYQTVELIRLDQSTPPPGTEAGEDAKRQLEAHVAGKTVRCYVKSRANDGYLICDLIVRE